jgi:threonine synthase
MDETGKLLEAPDMEHIRRDMWGTSVDDEQTRAAIAKAWQEHQVQLEPHGAVGWEGLERFFAAGQADEDALAVSLETAHPAKFPDEIIALTNVNPEPPPSLAGIDERPEHYDTIAVDYDAFRDLLLEKYA